MIESLDENIGALMHTLEESGVAGNTIVMVTGDNGGWLPSTNNNLRLRAGKGSPYEGGVRVPLIVHWPGVIRAGSTCDTPVIGCDLYPTILELAGAKPATGQIIDGQSIVTLLRNSGEWTREALFWHYPHYHPGGAKPYSAIRLAEWKLIRFYEENRQELYDLHSDPEEKTGLASSNPGKVSALGRRLDAWLKETGSQEPVSNPAYNPAKAHLTAAQAKAQGL